MLVFCTIYPTSNDENLDYKCYNHIQRVTGFMLKITINTFIAPSKEEIIQINDPYSYFKINPYFIIGTLLSIRTYPRIFRVKIKPLGSTFKPAHVRIDYKSLQVL